MFPTHDQIKLFWVSTLPENPKAHVAVVHGYAEHIGRYAHVFDDLAGRGYGVHGFDCRGHGRSEGKRAHVNRFSDYVDDLKLFLERVRVAASGKKVLLLGHSHGGLIAARYAISRPTELAAMVLTSPFLRLAFEPPRLKLFAAKSMGALFPTLAIGNEIKDEALTRDQAMVEAHKRDPLNLKITTPGWFNASTEAQRETLEGARNIVLPTAVFTGGSDPIAHTPTAKGFYESLGSSDKTYKEYPGALHEILNETNRAEVLNDVAAWLDKHST
jgi:alpha-beta hydrolase superfamily lysophospholipase